MELHLGNLEECFYEASHQGKRYVGVKIQMQGFPCPEIIINEYNNFDSKFEYYKKAYNDDLTLKAFNGIKIIAFSYGDSFADIEADLLGKDTMSYGEALSYLKIGKKIARKGWNGKGMFIYMQEGSTISSDDARNKHLSDLGVMEILLNPHIDMKTADGSITIGWVASQSDTFALDWMVVE